MPIENLEQQFAAHLNSLVTGVRSALDVPGTKAEIGLYGFFDKFFKEVVGLLRPHQTWTVLQQSSADDDAGIPDFKFVAGGELKGWIEIKAVVGKDLSKLSGHDKDQFERFKDGLTNFVFTNGWEWRLYRAGKQVGRSVFIGDKDFFDSATLSADSVDAEDSLALLEKFKDFVAAPGIAHSTVESAVSSLAQRARAMRSALVAVGEAGADDHLLGMRDDFKNLLYKNGQSFTWEKFVDSFVQVAAFGTLLWRLEKQTDVQRQTIPDVDASLHPMLAQSLKILWLCQIEELEPLLEELCETINSIPLELFAIKAQPQDDVPDAIVHAYEPFFREYNPAARDESGVYYTPPAVVEQITSGVDALLRTSLHKQLGLLEPSARFLDPATGTGTFLLGLLRAIAKVAKPLGLSAPDSAREVLQDRVAAFEIFPGPYAVAHQRIEAALSALGAPASDRLPIYLADTLAAPESGTLMSEFGALGNAIAHERQEADRIKTDDEILVILGNPPYERVKQSDFEPFAREFLSILREKTPADFSPDPPAGFRATRRV